MSEHMVTQQLVHDVPNSVSNSKYKIVTKDIYHQWMDMYHVKRSRSLVLKEMKLWLMLKDDAYNHYAKWKSPDTKPYTVHMFIGKA